jgi:tRNA A22 N-methylase
VASDILTDNLEEKKNQLKNKSKESGLFSDFLSQQKRSVHAQQWQECAEYNFGTIILTKAKIPNTNIFTDFFFS